MLLFCLHMKEKSPVFTISYIISSASLYRSSQLSSSLVRQIPLILFFKPYFSSLFITLQAYFEQSVFAYLSWREATSTEIGSRGQCCALKATDSQLLLTISFVQVLSYTVFVKPLPIALHRSYFEEVFHNHLLSIS